MEAGVSTGRDRERRGFGVQGQQRGEAVKGEEARAAATQVHCVAGIAKAPANPLQTLIRHANARDGSSLAKP